MKIVVCMKQVVDLAQLRFKADGRTPVLEGLPLKLGQFEKNALEAAVQIKEAGSDVQVIALSAGSPKLRDSIKEALAIGADEAVLIIDPALEQSDASGAARVLAAAIERIGDVDLLLLGEGSDDEYSGEIPARLAELLNLPQICTVRHIEVGAGSVRATRDLDAMLEVVESPLPALISVTSELNTPRLPALTAVMKAARKPQQVWSLADLGLEAAQIASRVEIHSNLAPQQSRKNQILEGEAAEQVQTLLRALEHEGVLA